jgi:hypothetical protein
LQEDDYTRRELLEIPSFENVTDPDDFIHVILDWVDPKDKEEF